MQTRRIGEQSKLWKGGVLIKRGYRKLNKQGKETFEHRLVMEAKLGRSLKPFPHEVVHHINEDKTDNRPENLVILTQPEHVELHKIKDLLKTLPVLRLANQPS